MGAASRLCYECDEIDIIITDSYSTFSADAWKNVAVTAPVTYACARRAGIAKTTYIVLVAAQRRELEISGFYKRQNSMSMNAAQRTARTVSSR